MNMPFEEKINSEGLVVHGRYHVKWDDMIYADEAARYYRQAYLSQQLQVSSSMIRDYMKHGRWSGRYYDGEWESERRSVLHAVDASHFIGDQPLDEASHLYTPKMWDVQTISHFYFISYATHDMMTIESMNRTLIRFCHQDSWLRHYRIGGYRFTREDWLQSFSISFGIDHMVGTRPTLNFFFFAAPFATDDERVLVLKVFNEWAHRRLGDDVFQRQLHMLMALYETGLDYSQLKAMMEKLVD